MIEIVPFAPDYAHAVETMERQSFKSPWGLESLLRTIGNPGAITLVALKDGQPVGYTVALVLGNIAQGHAGNDAELLKIAVLPDIRGNGIGKNLIQKLIDKLNDSGVNKIHLEVRESNRAARILYETCGFSYSGRRTGYYHSPHEDAVLMALQLK